MPRKNLPNPDIRPSFFEKKEELPLETEERVNELCAEITFLAQNYCQETFEKVRKRKEQEIPGPEDSWIMKKKRDFRKEPWFQQLKPEQQQRVEKKIANHIHSQVLISSERVYRNIVERIKEENPEAREIIERLENIRLVPVLSLRARKKLSWLFLSKLSNSEKEQVLAAMKEFERITGEPPGCPSLFIPNCASHNVWVNKIGELYGFEVREFIILDHSAAGIKIGKEWFVSDINYREEIIPFRRWFKEIRAVYQKKREKKFYFVHGPAETTCINFAVDVLNFFPEKKEEIKRALQRPVRTIPEDHNRLICWALVLAREGKKEEAVGLLQRLARRAGIGLKLSIIQLLLNIEEPGVALKEIEAIETELGDAEPDSEQEKRRVLDVISLRGEALLKLGRQREAFWTFVSAIERDPYYFFPLQRALEILVSLKILPEELPGLRSLYSRLSEVESQLKQEEVEGMCDFYNEFLKLIAEKLEE